MILLKGIGKKYKDGHEDFWALKDIDLDVNAKEFIAICGTSGSGKTTLLNIIGCLDTMDSGEYWLDGQNVSALNQQTMARIRNEKIGFVLQDFALINGQTVLYNVMLPLMLGKGSLKKAKEQAYEALQQVKMESYARKKVIELSGGQRQRVAIARAIVNRPNLLLADEPTGQLDSRTGNIVMSLLEELRSTGKTIIMVTHDKKLAERADRIVSIEDGHIN